MPTTISPLSQVHPSAMIGTDVQVGPFCLIGPDVRLGDDCVLDSHVTLTGHCRIGKRNRFQAGVVIGGEPQDKSYNAEAPTGVEIADDNTFREGVTVNRGAEKEDHWTHLGSRNLLMANAHVAHNCQVGDDTMLVNGVLLGGHVHVQDRAIISGNTVVHHFTTIGMLGFVSGGCRVVRDLPPFMLAAGNENPQVKTINIVGMRRAGIDEATIRLIKRAHRLVYREHRKHDEVRGIFEQELTSGLPAELQKLLLELELTTRGTSGRGREAFRNVNLKPVDTLSDETSPEIQRKAA
ncbi:MAG: acyl-ACP--UDP-N-acetylglucosamine O-acyltransferase [Planctomycetaceae bacterium]